MGGICDWLREEEERQRKREQENEIPDVPATQIDVPDWPGDPEPETPTIPVPERKPVPNWV